jgi:hypothetical protein
VAKFAVIMPAAGAMACVHGKLLLGSISDFTFATQLECAKRAP